MFYLLASLLLSMGFVLVVAALYRPSRRAGDADARQTVAAVYQDRLFELRSEMQRGLAESDDRETLEAELGAALLSDYDELAEVRLPDGQAPAPSRWLPVAAGGLLVAVVMLVYSLVGDPQAQRLTGAEELLSLDSAEDSAEIAGWRERLIDRVDARPGDAKSWYLLGHADLKLGRFSSAAEAFAMANQVHGDDPSIDIYWLQARYMAANGTMDAVARTIAERLLTGNPNHPMVLEMLAIESYRQGNFQESVSLLNRALSGNLSHGERQTLNTIFDEARRKLGDQPASVDVAIETVETAPADATLFVIARPVGGGIPFAVVRRPAAGAPETIRLDDAVSMNPAAPLSAAGEVEVVVRLSRTGTAMAHPGDWEWHSEPLKLANTGGPVRLTATLKPPS